MGKKEETEKLCELADELIADESFDRERLSRFFDRLLDAAATVEESVGIAEYVAKISDAMTKQNTTRLNTIKALKKSVAAEDDSDDVEAFDEIGRPFEEDHGEN